MQKLVVYFTHLQCALISSAHFNLSFDIVTSVGTLHVYRNSVLTGLFVCQ